MIPGTPFRAEEVTAIDLQRRLVTTSSPITGREVRLPYDHLVLALGNTINLASMPGAAQHGKTMKSLGDALHLRNHVISMLEAADVETDLAMRQELLTFVVAGAGYSGVETVGELNDLVHKITRHYPSLMRESVKVILLHSRDRILPEMGPGLADFALKKLRQPSTLKFLRAYPTLQAARAATAEELAALLKQARYPGAKLAAQRMAAQLQQPCLQANEVTTRTKSRLMLALVDQLEPLLKQIADYDKEIARLFLRHADSELFQALPGAGARLAPRLLAEMGDDRSRYESACSLQAQAFTSPVLFQSGTYQKAHRRLGCIKPWRHALQQFAWESTRQEAWAKEYYQRKRTEGKSHTVAVRALATVWARMLYAIWKQKEPYQTTTFEQARRAHAPRPHAA